MKALSASAIGAKSGLLLGAALFAFLRWREPAFFARESGETIAWLATWALVPAALAFLLGLALGRRGGAIASGLAAAFTAFGLATLFLDPDPDLGDAKRYAGLHGMRGLLFSDPTGRKLVGCALAAFVVGALLARRKSLASRRGTIATLLLSLVLVIAGVAAPPPPVAHARASPGKIFVFGLDAGTWTILNELFKKDELPNLRKLRDEGSYGVLRSELASLSPRVWTTIATGKLPEKHGMRDFFCTQNDDLKVARVWEMLHADAKEPWSVGLFQYLETWPPDPFEPFIVPAWMARGPETQPPELSFIKELEQVFQTGEADGWSHRGELARAFHHYRAWARGYLDHGLRLKTLLSALALFGSSRSPQPTWEKSYASKRQIQLLINGDVYLDLYRRTQPDFSCFICYGTDNLAHKFWQYHYPDDFGIPHEKAAPFAELLTDYYRAADALLGEILPLLPAQTTIAVLSDHGFSSTGDSGVAQQHEHRPSLDKLARLMGLADQVTTANVATRGYLTPRAKDEAGARAVFERAMAFLNACEDLDAHAKVFKPSVIDSGQIEVAINLDVDHKRESRVSTPKGERRYSDLVDVEDRTGNHSIEGVVILRGPNVRRGRRIEGARLQDVTPTLLYLCQKPRGADMDGVVLTDAIEPAFTVENPLDDRIHSWDDLVHIERKPGLEGNMDAAREYARSLGYVGGDKGDKKDEAEKKDEVKKGDGGGN